MSKYNSLWLYFDDKNAAEIKLSFNELQDILGFPIDHSFLTYKKELNTYGYCVKKIYLKEKIVVFEKSKE